MKKSAHYIQFLIILILMPAWGMSQSIAQKRADKLFNNLQFAKAIKIYEILQKDHPDNYLFAKRLAYANYKMGAYQDALEYYSVFVESEEAVSEDWFQYAQLLKIDGNYPEAQNWLEKYLSKNPGDELAKKQLDKISHLEEHQSPLNFMVRRTSKNTRFTDMCPVIHNGNLIFSSSRDTFSVVANDHLWNNQPFLDLYTSGFHKRTLYEIREFSKELNSRFHEGPVVFSNDGNTIFFTRNNYANGKKKKTSKGLNNLKIFISEWDGKKWAKETEFPYNSDEYSVGHPALSNDGQTIYFVSDMPGGYGETDIYKSTKTYAGWSQPINLGTSINTREKEMFPTVDTKNNIFFSSNGQPGYGGLDIFVALHDSIGNYQIINLGSKLNSTFDDFSLIFDHTGEAGYLTSNRPGGAGADDIYYFELKALELKINVRDKTTNEPLPEADVDLVINGENEARKITNKDGTVFFDVKVGTDYKLVGTKKNYHSTSDRIKINFSEEPFKKVLFLDPQN